MPLQVSCRGPFCALLNRAGSRSGGGGLSGGHADCLASFKRVFARHKKSTRSPKGKKHSQESNDTNSTKTKAQGTELEGAKARRARRDLEVHPQR